MKKILSVLLMVIMINVAFNQVETVKRTEFNKQFAELSSVEKHNVMSEFIDLLDGSQDFTVYRTNQDNSFYYPSNATLMYGDVELILNDVIVETMETIYGDKMRDYELSMFVYTHELSHALTVGVQHMKDYSKQLDKVIKISKTEGDDKANIAYREITYEKVADLGGFYIIDQYQDIIQLIMDGKSDEAEYKLTRRRRIETYAYLDRLLREIAY